ncbi:MAG: hypothetical protein BWZ04_03065 [Firmicutes bacterium ADurb.BinA205]|nr:MAG: hypothetical protein BWZ04_03065 [Firmicutes bacterium ADurb.BinA205]
MSLRMKILLQSLFTLKEQAIICILIWISVRLQCLLSEMLRTDLKSTARTLSLYMMRKLIFITVFMKLRNTARQKYTMLLPIRVNASLLTISKDISATTSMRFQIRNWLCSWLNTLLHQMNGKIWLIRYSGWAIPNDTNLMKLLY